MTSLPRRRTVADVMTARVHVAGPLTPFKLLVRLIQENRVSAIPIVDVNGFPMGIVSETDLLLKERRHELETEPDLLHLRRRQRERAKADGLVASDLMTTPPITVSSTTGLTLAARMMQVRNVRRLIVVDDRGRIAGVVSRSDLLQVFLRTDEELRDEIVHRLIPALMLSPEQPVGVEVRYNVVTLTGEVDRRSDAEILARMTKALDGVVEVVSQLTYKWDDSRPVRAFAQPAIQTTESI
ncbi:MAG TPA: CBS domain-containing protein [Candidatus Dormibacteraeota bacterium]|nr:CBS domain-containing protein [Candidatus Dormibacteraeota bacterium]